MRRPTPTLIVAIVCCFTLCVLVLPRQNKFGYAYEQGRPWLYNTLIADYDFPIYKSDHQLQADRDSALADFQPFFQLTDSMAQRQGRHLLSDWQDGRFHGVSYNHVAHVGRLLEKVYAVGIVSNQAKEQMRLHRTKNVRVVQGTLAASRKADSLLTPLAAYALIMQADTVHFPRQELSRLNLNHYLVPNLSYDSLRTRGAQEGALAQVSQTLGMVQSGERIIERGEIVSPAAYNILRSFERECELRQDDTGRTRYVLAGQIGVTLGIILLMVVYLRLYRRDVLASPHHVALIFALLTLFPVLTALMVAHNWFSVYLLPYAMAPIFIRVFIDSRTAVMHLLATVLLASLSLHQPYTFILTQLTAGLVAVYSLRELTARAQILRSAVIVTATSCVLGIFFEFTQGNDFHTLDTQVIYYKLVSGVLLLLAYPLMLLIERLFKFTSDVTLIELSNINHPLLSRMSKVAPGSFQHSMQVANLAVEVAHKIEAESLLVRTGALYHDIGKTVSPAFFTENQAGHNPHDQFTEEQSAAIIISHVTEGMRLADKYDLPDEIRQFILTHHGTSRVGYFYQQAVNRRGADHVNPADFTYPGRLPFRREHAILTMADSVEAASRSLKEYTDESIQQLVDKIIDGQLAAGYFKECPISFRDISLAKQVFVESLRTVYHTRIAYPAEANNKSADSNDKSADSNDKSAERHFGFRTLPFGLHRRNNS